VLVFRSRHIVLLFFLAAGTTSAQGLVTFLNWSNETVTVGSLGQQTPISGPAGSYYFGLLIAAPGTTDPSQFIFADVYATNLDGAPGRLYGGGAIPVPSWFPGTTKSFLVAGWSSSLGHDWNAQWQSGIFDASGFFGLSSVATGISGGAGVPPGPPLSLFAFGNSPTGINTGWNLAPVSPIPEPAPFSLAGFGTALFVFIRQWRTMTHASNQSWQPTPGFRLAVFPTPLARSGCTHR
jgi:hypothetical protein